MRSVYFRLNGIVTTFFSRGKDVERRKEKSAGRVWRRPVPKGLIEFSVARLTERARGVGSWRNAPRPYLQSVRCTTQSDRFEPVKCAATVRPTPAAPRRPSHVMERLSIIEKSEHQPCHSKRWSRMAGPSTQFRSRTDRWRSSTLSVPSVMLTAVGCRLDSHLFCYPLDESS